MILFHLYGIHSHELAEVQSLHLDVFHCFDLIQPPFSDLSKLQSHSHNSRIIPTPKPLFQLQTERVYSSCLGSAAEDEVAGAS